MKPMQNYLKDMVFGIQTEAEFNRAALAVFRHQTAENACYANYLKALQIKVDDVNRVENIPFLPIGFFKTHQIISGRAEPQITFSSSGTTGSVPSKHPVVDVTVYEESFIRGFEIFYGKPDNWCILALLPAYLERQGSSLVFMANELIKRSSHQKSGFYLSNLPELRDILFQLAKEKTPTILLGVSFALLDLAEMTRGLQHEHLVVMETGGMKGRKKEMIREDLHAILSLGFGVENIHSEYGMTELLSQAYAPSKGLFRTPPWMKVLVRDTTDPLSLLPPGKSGGLNIIDLANYHSCSFIATEDLGRKHNDGTFEVLGRFDTAEIRGCNLMVVM